MCCFFSEHVRELCFFILKRKEGEKDPRVCVATHVCCYAKTKMDCVSMVERMWYIGMFNNMQLVNENKNTFQEQTNLDRIKQPKKLKNITSTHGKKPRKKYTKVFQYAG